MLDLHRLAIVLKHANASPPPHGRDEFYRLKEAILNRYGERDGEDVQEIRHDCWGADYDRCGPTCRKCGGTGIWHRFYVELERWKMGGQVFHKPLNRLAFCAKPVTIQGKIRHRRTKLSFACWRVLSLLLCPQWFIYLDLYRSSEEHVRQFKAVLAYLLCFDRHKWTVEAFRFSEVEEAHKRLVDQMVPF